MGFSTIFLPQGSGFRTFFVLEGWGFALSKNSPGVCPEGWSGLELTDTLSLLSVDYLYWPAATLYPLVTVNFY